jgi:hypothetical protein
MPRIRIYFLQEAPLRGDKDRAQAASSQDYATFATLRRGSSTDGRMTWYVHSITQYEIIIRDSTDGNEDATG